MQTFVGGMNGKNDIIQLNCANTLELSKSWFSLRNARFVLQHLTYTQPEVIEGMSVDAIQLANHCNSKLHHDPNLGLLSLFVLMEKIIQSFQCVC